MIETCDVSIIGAGPSGAIAASILARNGWSVKVFERSHFPRFSIGESLLPQCVEFLREADLLADVEAHGFQFKDGAAFSVNGDYREIYFPDKSSPGPETVLQVRRDEFDDILIRGAARNGADVTFGAAVTRFSTDLDGACLQVEDEAGQVREIKTKFVLDASGFGRVLPRLLDLDVPSDQPVRISCFKHVRDQITDRRFDRNKILISIHPDFDDVWLWLIPLADGRSSIGCVGSEPSIRSAGDNADAQLWHFVKTSGLMADFLVNAEELTETRQIQGYSIGVKAMSGERFALLGNAAEFLDPVFSSGVTMAMKSASLASGLVDRQLRGGEVDWDAEFSAELKSGANAFRACVNAWYSGLLPRLIFMDQRSEDITRHMTSVLAGYVWDRTNPIVRDPNRFFSIMESFVDA